MFSHLYRYQMFKTLSFASQKMLARDALDIYLKKDIDIRILFHENGEERIGRVKILFASKVKTFCSMMMSFRLNSTH